MIKVAKEIKTNKYIPLLVLWFPHVAFSSQISHVFILLFYLINDEAQTVIAMLELSCSMVFSHSLKFPLYFSFLQTTKRPLTAGTLFKNSMIALVNNLASKEPYYIRCIKPNEQKSPVIFDQERVIHQVRAY